MWTKCWLYGVRGVLFTMSAHCVAFQKIWVDNRMGMERTGKRRIISHAPPVWSVSTLGSSAFSPSAPMGSWGVGRVAIIGIEEAIELHEIIRWFRGQHQSQICRPSPSSPTCKLVFLWLELTWVETNWLSPRFFKYILSIMLLKLSHLFPLCAPPTNLPRPSSSPPFSSHPWVVCVSSLASPFPILFLTSPSLFCTYQLCFLIPAPFPLAPLSW